MTKRAIDIEKLLTWAYREELSKREHQGLLGVSNFALVSNYAQEMCETVDDGRPGIANRYFQLYGDGPHPDAVKVEEAVKALDGFTPVLHEDPALFFSDMPAELQAEAEGAMDRYDVQLVPLIIRCASMGSRPLWRIADVPTKVPFKPDGWGHPPYYMQVKVTGAFGTPGFVERIVNRDPKTRRPPPGAYHKMVWRPEPWTVIDGRVDWLIWLSALSTLAESLRDTLGTFLPHAPMLNERPWETLREDAQESPRVLKSLTMSSETSPQAAPRRRMLKRVTMPKAGPLREIVRNGIPVGA